MAATPPPGAIPTLPMAIVRAREVPEVDELVVFSKR